MCEHRDHCPPWEVGVLWVTPIYEPMGEHRLANQALAAWRAEGFQSGGERREESRTSQKVMVATFIKAFGIPIQQFTDGWI